MITILKHTEDGLATLEQFVSGCWISVIDPTPDEIIRLHQELGVPQDFLTYPLDMDELSRTEKEDNATLIVLRIPYLQSETAEVCNVSRGREDINPHSRLKKYEIHKDGLRKMKWVD